eukprot:Awhi_evm1s10
MSEKMLSRVVQRLTSTLDLENMINRKINENNKQRDQERADKENMDSDDSYEAQMKCIRKERRKYIGRVKDNAIPKIVNHCINKKIDRLKFFHLHWKSNINRMLRKPASESLTPSTTEVYTAIPTWPDFAIEFPEHATAIVNIVVGEQRALESSGEFFKVTTTPHVICQDIFEKKRQHIIR